MNMSEFDKMVKEVHGAPPQEYENGFDVTYEQLRHLGDAPGFRETFELIARYWVGRYYDEERAKKLRCGTIYRSFDEDGHLVLKFVSRISFPDEVSNRKG